MITHCGSNYRVLQNEHQKIRQLVNGRGGPIPTVWNVRSWPTTYLIDQDGVIRSTAYAKNLDAKIEKLVAEAEKANAKK